MRVVEKGAPAAAIVAALTTLTYCVPLGFLGALGLAGWGVWAQPLRPWLLGSSVVLLCMGFVQLYLRKSQCVRRSALSVILFWGAAAVVILVILFPQVVAGFIAR